MNRAIRNSGNRAIRGSVPLSASLVTDSSLIIISVRVFGAQGEIPYWISQCLLLPLFGDGPNTVSESTVSNSELSEVFLPSLSSRKRTQ